MSLAVLSETQKKNLKSRPRLFPERMIKVVLKLPNGWPMTRYLSVAGQEGERLLADGAIGAFLSGLKKGQVGFGDHEIKDIPILPGFIPARFLLTAACKDGKTRYLGIRAGSGPDGIEFAIKAAKGACDALGPRLIVAQLTLLGFDVRRDDGTLWFRPVKAEDLIWDTSI